LDPEPDPPFEVDAARIGAPMLDGAAHSFE